MRKSSASRSTTSITDDAELAQKLEDACPVDIFAARDGRVEVVEENLDECVLCELCVKAAPAGKLRVPSRTTGRRLRLSAYHGVE
jgi:NAD-dependent dihydropyrimidine dehydrogenase PreA subunit